MQVAIDSGPLESGHKVRGVGAYVSELIRALEQEATKVKELEIDAFDFSADRPTSPRLRGASLSPDANHFDIIHYTHFHPYFLTLPARISTKTVVTIHDLIQLIYPKQYQPGIKGSMRLMQQKRRIKNVNAVIVPSETTKKDVVRFLNIPSEKIQVVYEAPRKIFKKMDPSSKRVENVRKKYNLPTRFALYVGDINFNKNIPQLISACNKAAVDLVICGKQAKEIESQVEDMSAIRGPRDWLRFIIGKPHPELAHYRMLIKEFKENDKIHKVGFVPDRDLVAIYNCATCYIQPSLYEGFGLPVLEAMASGTPVLVTKTNALVEIADGAALVADPRNKEDLAEKIGMLFSDAGLRAKLIKEGEKRAKEFSWKKAAEETIEVYKDVVGSM